MIEIVQNIPGTSSTQVSLQVWMIEIVQTIPDISSTQVSLQYPTG